MSAASVPKSVVTDFLMMVVLFLLLEKTTVVNLRSSVLVAREITKPQPKTTLSYVARDVSNLFLRVHANYAFLVVIYSLIPQEKYSLIKIPLLKPL